MSCFVLKADTSSFFLQVDAQLLVPHGSSSSFVPRYLLAQSCAVASSAKGEGAFRPGHLARCVAAPRTGLKGPGCDAADPNEAVLQTLVDHGLVTWGGRWHCLDLPGNVLRDPAAARGRQRASGREPERERTTTAPQSTSRRDKLNRPHGVHVAEGRILPPGWDRANSSSKARFSLQQT